MSFDNFCDYRLADANQCQFTNEASIDFPLIGFIDCSSPVDLRALVYMFDLRFYLSKWTHNQKLSL